jgi:hypothetical protein
MPKITYRKLRTEELARIPKEALQSYPEELRKVARAFAALDASGEIIGVLLTFNVVHAEPLWVREDYRNHPRILKRLWDGVRSLLQGSGVDYAVSVILDSLPVTRKIAIAVGGIEIPGKVFLYPVDVKE